LALLTTLVVTLALVPLVPPSSCKVPAEMVVPPV
jgi:hypothetical protein